MDSGPLRSRGFLWIVLVVGVLAAVGLLRDWSTSASKGPGAGGRPPVPVVVAEAGTQEFVDRMEAIGTARSNEAVVITAKVTETVRDLHFEDGMVVEEGAVLVEFTSDEESAQLSEASTNLADARRNHRRVATLHEQGTAPRSQLDTATAARDAARARVEALQARLADRLIRAPFAGVLGLRSVSPGTLVKPGDTITTLDDVRVMKLDFAIPEKYLSALEPGQEVDAVSAAYPDSSFRGLVKTVGSRVDPVTRAVTVRAELPNSEGLLRPGMLLTLDVIRSRADALAVPEEALVPDRERKFVFVVGSDDAIERREVEIGRRRPGWVEVTKGLVAGERVVVEGTTRVRDGATVVVKPNP